MQYRYEKNKSLYFHEVINNRSKGKIQQSVSNISRECLIFNL